MTHPFRGPKVDIGEAVAFIAAELYPSENKRTARDRVRQAFRYHQKKGTLPRGDSLEVSAILGWVRDQWPELRKKIPGPLKATGRVRPALRATASVFFVPRDPEELREFAIEGERDRRRMTAEIARLRSDLDAAKLQIAELTQRKAETRAKAVAAGKQGGRGKSK